MIPTPRHRIHRTRAEVRVTWLYARQALRCAACLIAAALLCEASILFMRAHLIATERGFFGVAWAMAPIAGAIGAASRAVYRWSVFPIGANAKG